MFSHKFGDYPLRICTFTIGQKLAYRVCGAGINHAFEGKFLPELGKTCLAERDIYSFAPVLETAVEIGDPVTVDIAAALFETVGGKGLPSVRTVVFIPCNQITQIIGAGDQDYQPQGKSDISSECEFHRSSCGSTGGCVSDQLLRKALAPQSDLVTSKVKIGLMVGSV